MKCVVFSSFPHVCEKEIKTIIKKDSTIHSRGCTISDITPNQLAILSYRLQSAYRVGIYMGQTKDITPPIIDKEIKDILSKAKTFAVEVNKQPSQLTPSMDLASEWGATLKETLSLEVNLTIPDIKIFIDEGTEGYVLTIDIIGFDLTKRPYKVFNNPTSLNGAVAFALCAYANIKPSTILLDPFCGSGVIPIEASLFQQERSSFVFEQRFSGLNIPFLVEEFKNIQKELLQKKVSNKQRIFGYDDQLRIILGAKKNAKIAGVSESISFSKVSIDWMDAKFEEHSVDCIVTVPPEDSKKRPKKKKSKESIEELFYQAKYILKQKGTINLMVHYDEPVKEIAQKHLFKLVKEDKIAQGKQTRSILQFQKQK